MGADASLGVLYTFRRCPYAIRARMALAAADLEVEVREVSLKNKPDALLQASPKGTVPVLALTSGAVVDESLAVMTWALERRDPHGWLARTQAGCRARIAANDGPFKQALDAYKYPWRNASDPEVAWSEALGYLRPLDEQCQSEPYLGGAEPSLADVAIFPFIRQFAAVDADRFASALPLLDTWLNGWLENATFKRIMAKVPVWAPGDSPRYFSTLFS